MSRLSSFQTGRGIPFEEPQREVPTGDDVITPYTLKPFTYDGNGDVVLPDILRGNNALELPSKYEAKFVKVINVDLTSTFTDAVYNIPGTIIFWSGQAGGTAAAIKVRLDNFQNDRMSMVFDRGISGIPFKQFYLTNETAQPGITAELTIISDRPFDRVGVTG